MPKSMVIVESPAKAKTIGKYLGKDFSVKACAGHIKDLPKKDLGVDIEHGFQPTYMVIPGKEKILRELKKEAGKVRDIYLAADPDREGEAICFHLGEELNGSRGHVIHRVLFNEITKKAIEEAFEHPTQIDSRKVEAQQARRILDRLVGYQLSPLLWEKVRKGLSAGRVQTVAVRLIVDREVEIRNFKPEEYWNFIARLKAQEPPPFEAKAVRYQGKKFKISNQQQADQLLAELQKAEFVVSAVNQKERRRNPVPPFITSKLQQDASRQLGFSVKKTMTLAQRLYEGVELGKQGSVGLITYMRTDSTRISPSALDETRSFIGTKYGADYLPAKAQVYRSKKGAQDAHEAIRPTDVELEPSKVKPYLERDAFRLYDLIWKRMVASQMTPALFDQTEIEIEAGPADFKAVGSILKFDGFLKVYQEGRDTDQADDSESEEGDDGRLLPKVEKGEKLTVDDLLREQKFTQPPPRYTEATLVKALEEKGIGRPSTYQQILSVIMTRDYVQKVDKRFQPTEIGEMVVGLLVSHFQELFDYDYTAKLEEDLDQIEDGKEDWIQALNEFYQGFEKKLKQAKSEMRNVKKEEIPTNETCEKCGSGMVIRFGRFGQFLACSNFPDCKNTRELVKEGSLAKQLQSSEKPQETCDKCGREMVAKKGRYGEFLACSGYPDCKNTKKLVQKGGEVQVHQEKPLDEKCPRCGSNLVQKHGRFGEFVACGNYPDCRYIKTEGTGVTCPTCGQGELVKRKSRRGKVFYGCERYPDCDFVLWNKPLQKNCPKCDMPFLVEKTTKREGTVCFCHNPDCDYQEAVEEVSANG